MIGVEGGRGASFEAQDAVAGKLASGCLRAARGRTALTREIVSLSL